MRFSRSKARSGGIDQYRWFPETTGFDYKLAPSHEPLAHLREHFSVLTNLSHIEGRISGHVHPHNWLTGHNINLTPGAITNTVSMDQVAAKHFGPTWLPSLALSFTDGVGTATLLTFINHPRLLTDSKTLDTRLKSKPGMAPTEAIEWLYLTTLSRRPDQQESAEALAYVEKAKDPPRAYRGLLWMLVNRSEFILIR